MSVVSYSRYYVYSLQYLKLQSNFTQQNYEQEKITSTKAESWNVPLFSFCPTKYQLVFPTICGHLEFRQASISLLNQYCVLSAWVSCTFSPGDVHIQITYALSVPHFLSDDPAYLMKKFARDETYFRTRHFACIFTASSIWNYHIA